MGLRRRSSDFCSLWRKYPDRSRNMEKGDVANMPPQVFFFFFFFFFFLGLYLHHMEVPRLGVKSELPLLARTPATPTSDPSEARDRTLIPRGAS